MKLNNMLLILFIVMLYTSPALAAGTGPWETALNTILEFLTGTTGRVLGALAVAASGIMMMFGMMQLQRFVMILIGISILFGAVEIVDLFAS